MYGPDVDTLTVYIKEKGKLTVVWTKTGTADPAWHQALVPIQSDNKIQVSMYLLKLTTCKILTFCSQVLMTTPSKKH